MKNKEMRENEY